jgi:hypothetical protein
MRGEPGVPDNPYFRSAVSGIPRTLLRPFWRAFRFCLNGGDSNHFQPAARIFVRKLKRHIATFESGGGSLLDGDFSEHLKYFSGRPSLKLLHPYVFDMFNLRYRDYLYSQIAALIVERGETIPQLETVHANPDCFAEIVARSDACLVLALHTGFPHNARLLTGSGRSRVTAIFGDTDWAEALYRNNRVTDYQNIRLVRADRNTLINLHSSVRDGHAICCNPDHINPVTSKCDLISRAMFEFAARKDVQTYFIDYAVTDQGRLKVFSEAVAPGTSPDHAIEQFCAFCFQSSGRRVRPMTKSR